MGAARLLRTRLPALVGATVGILALGACSAAPPRPPVSPAPAISTHIPAYDGSLPPARAVLALVPRRARTLRLVDWAQVRRQVGLPELTSRSPAGDRSAFQARAADAAPVLDPALLRPVDSRLRTAYGFGVDDVTWEAHFAGGGSRGWVLAFRTGVDMTAVRRAVEDAVGRLRDAHVDVPDRLVTKGVAAPHQPVWGSDPTWRRLVPAPGEAFMVHRGCVTGGPVRAPATLAPLSGFSITFGDHVATVRVNRDREDLFARLRVGRRGFGGSFGRVFRNGVADPSTGRIGYDVPRPAQAVPLVRKGLLPVGMCAPED